MDNSHRAGWTVALVAMAVASPAAFAQDATAPAAAAAQTSMTPERALAPCPVAAHLMGLRYQQRSAEVRALQLQGYALATLRLQEALAASHPPRHPAIMTDLDETAIDNTALLVRDMQACHDFTKWDTWLNWEQYGNPRAIPGALAFFDYANAHGVTIYYVSGRTKRYKADTMATLKKLGFPQVDASHVMLDFSGPPKQVYRDQIAKDHTIVLQLGDSLADVSNDYDKASLAVQRADVERDAAHFGKDWIIFPDAAYGTWKKATLQPWSRALPAQFQGTK